MKRIQLAAAVRLLIHALAALGRRTLRRVIDPMSTMSGLSPRFWLRALRLIGLTILIAMPNLTGSASAAQNSSAAVGAIRRAVKVTEALNSPSGLSVRGTITNSYVSDQNATCNSSSFLLVGNGRVYQGTVQCDGAEIAPGTTTAFIIVFPVVDPGTYHLRYQRLHDPKYRYEMAPIRLGLRAH